MLKVDINADSKFPVDRRAIRSRVAQVLTDRRVTGDFYVSVSVIGNRKMRAINHKYRHKDYPTDVLSFPTQDPSQDIDDHGFFHSSEPMVLGDILVSYPEAVLIASEKNRLLDEVVCDLVEHGMLHLLGIHHD